MGVSKLIVGEIVLRDKNNERAINSKEIKVDKIWFQLDTNLRRLVLNIVTAKVTVKVAKKLDIQERIKSSLISKINIFKNYLLYFKI